MNLVVIAVFIAVCGAAKLDRTYLPPASANSAGGSSGSLQTPLTRSSDQGVETPRLPTGSYTNSFEGVVVDAAAPGTRASADADVSGLGDSRPSYGSLDSKVGDAAFRGSVAGFRNTPSFGSASGHYGQYNNQAGPNFSTNDRIDTHAGHFSNKQENDGQIGSNAGQFSSNRFSSQSFQDFENKSERPQAANDRNSNILSLSNDVNSETYSYGFETDNGIAVGENGVAVNGVQAEGGYSYQGDDGHVYKVTYTADEGGYRPRGDHLPTPPPIPAEILKSLEQNAKEEAAGLVDDGSYDAQKYNTDSDYTHDNSGNIQYNSAQLSLFGKRPESDATASGTFINQNGQKLGKPGFGSNANNVQSSLNGAPSINGATGQFGISGTHSSPPSTGLIGSNEQNSNFFNGQFNQGIRKPGQFGVSGSSSTHSNIGQSSKGNGDQFRPDFNSGQRGDGSFQSSHSSQPLNGHQDNAATGHAFDQTTNKQFSSSSEQVQGAFENQAHFASQFSQQDSVEKQHSSSPQFGIKPTNPTFGQNTDSSAFISESDKPQFGSSFKPQGSEAFSGASLNQDQDKQDFGKPFPQTFSGQNFNRPSAGNFNPNKPGQIQTNNFGSTASFNRFSQTSGQFGAINEYLPPVNGQTQIQNYKEPVTGFNSKLSNSGSISAALEFNSNLGQKSKGQAPDFMALNEHKTDFSTASASASFGQPAVQLQPAKPLNAFDMSSKFQYNPNKLANQQTQIQQTSQSSSQTLPNFNTNFEPSGSLVHTGLDFSLKPTSVPETELTTPLETPTSQGSQFPSQTTASFGTFDSKPASNNQALTQFGFQGNSAFGQQSTSQTFSPSFPTSAPQSPNSQFGSPLTQPAFQSSVSKRPENSNEKPQFPQNSFGQNQSKQPSFSQGADSSYYYNQPSKPFSTPVIPQGSRFPGSPSYQSNGLAAKNQYFNQQSVQSSTKFPGSLAPVSPTSPTQFAQNTGYNGITQAAISPFPAASPTPSGQFGFMQNNQFGSKPDFNQQSKFGNLAQSSRPSLNQQPTSSNQAHSFGSQKNKPVFHQPAQSAFPSSPVSQFEQKPTLSVPQTQTQFGQTNTTPESGTSQQQTTMTQQYQGTIYQYNKPAEVLPSPTETDSSSSQTIEMGVTSDSSSSQSQSNQLPTQQYSKPGNTDSKLGNQNYKPFSNGPSPTQFGEHTQTSHDNKAPQQSGFQFGSQPAKPFNAPILNNNKFGQNSLPEKPFGASTPTQFGQSQSTPDSSSALQLNTQVSQAGAFKPFGNGATSQGIQSSLGSKPQPDSPAIPSFSQATQSFGSSQTSYPSRDSVQSHFNSQNVGNTALRQNTGYSYPGNPKPQFHDAEISKNKFSQSSQSGKPQSFNHNSENTNNQFDFNYQSGSLPTESFNQQPSQSQFNLVSKPQYGDQPQTQYTQTTQGQIAQKGTNSLIQPFSQPELSPSIASSQATASGQASASAFASSSPQQPQYNPFGQNKPQIPSSQQPGSQDQSVQSSLQNSKPVGSHTQKPSDVEPFGALNSEPSRIDGQSPGSSMNKPLFNSPCCQSSKDSTSAQSTDRPSQAFQGTQAFNAQSVAGQGEVFGGPRQPPRFDDQTGYHY